MNSNQLNRYKILKIERYSSIGKKIMPKVKRGEMSGCIY
jgi:hypothetical protein